MSGKTEDQPQAEPIDESPLNREVRCAFCDSTDVELFSLYGQTLLGTQYYCRNCRSIFEAIRYDEEDE